MINWPPDHTTRPDDQLVMPAFYRVREIEDWLKETVKARTGTASLDGIIGKQGVCPDYP